MNNNNNIPEEISVNPVPYISLIGLDAANNSIHSLIWNSFAINRTADRPVLYYKLLNNDHQFPSSKHRRSYDRYIPTGIIKTKWLNKHLFEIPSLVAVFALLPDWQQLDRRRLIDQINSLKLTLTNRQVKIAVILLQSEPVPITCHQDPDANQYKDQAARLCEECDINPKSLFIIPIQDEQSIPAYVIRIELALNDLVKQHFSVKVKQIKSYRDQLNKATQNYLFVRHEFKLGFYHEIRQIYNQALVHYKNAYASLMEIRLTSKNLFEIKNVATILNYKIIRLSFYINIPLDAISYFRKHIDIFQNRFADDERLQFEHYAWLANQFFLFGELFDMSISMLHLSPSSSQNPGVYYFESAMYMIKRRESSKKFKLSLALNTDEIVYAERLLQQNQSEFIGQLNWYQPDESNDIYVKIFYYIEQKIDLAPLLIKLYINVLNQIKKFKKPRFMRFVMYLIGMEYFQQANYNDALDYFGNILGYYREERWKPIHKRLAKFALCSAYLSMDFVNVCKCTIEYISNDIVDLKCKSLLLKSLLSFLRLEFQQYHLNDEDFEKIIDQKILFKAESEWPLKLAEIDRNGLPQSNSNNEILINSDHEINFLKCKVKFNCQQYTIEDDIHIMVAIFNQLDEQFDSIDVQIKFEIPDFDKQCQLLSQQQQPIIYPNSLNLFKFRLQLLPSDRQYSRIKISEIAFILKSKISIRFQWLYNISISTTISPIISITNDSIHFNKIDQQIEATILELESRFKLIDIDMKQYLFRNENASIRLRLQSQEHHVISNLKLRPKIITQQQQQQQVAIAATETNIDTNIVATTTTTTDSNDKWFIRKNDDIEPIPFDSDILIAEQIEPCRNNGDDEIIINLIFCPQDLGTKLLSFEFNYDLIIKRNNNNNEIDQKSPISILKNFQKSINVIEPFQFVAKITNFANPDTSIIRFDEPFRLNCYLRLPKNNDDNDEQQQQQDGYYNIDDDSIEIDSISTNFNENFQINSQEMMKLPMLLAKDLTTSIDSYIMTCIKSEQQQPHSLGSWSIRWHRKSQSVDAANNTAATINPILSETIFQLPSITIIPAIIYIELFLPDKLYARNPFMAKYRITSRLDVDVNLELHIGQAEYFMIAGNRQIKIILPSRSMIEQMFIFFPLTCGQLVLPKLDIMVHPLVSNSLSILTSNIGVQNRQTITHSIKIDYIGQMISSTVFVLPKLRTNINL